MRSQFELVVDAFGTAEALSTSQIRERTGIKKPSLKVVLHRMIENGVLKVVGYVQGVRGKPQRLFVLSSPARVRAPAVLPHTSSPSKSNTSG